MSSHRMDRIRVRAFPECREATSNAPRIGPGQRFLDRTRPHVGKLKRRSSSRICEAHRTNRAQLNTVLSRKRPVGDAVAESLGPHKLYTLSKRASIDYADGARQTAANVTKPPELFLKP